MPATNYLRSALLNHYLGAVTYTAPATVYIGLLTADPTASGSMAAEPGIGTNGYARVAVTNNATNFPNSSGGSAKQNGIAITFPESTGAWASGSNLTYFFVADAASAGNMSSYAALGTARTVGAAGVTLSFAINALTHTLT